MIKQTVVSVAALFLAGSAFAQSPPLPPPISVVGAANTLAVTAASARIALTNPAVYPTVLIINDGTAELFYAIGNSSVTANATSVGVASIPIPPGQSAAVWAGGATNVAAITAAGTTTMRIVQSNGAPFFVGGGGTGGGGGGGGTSSNFGVAFPNAGTAVGMSQNGNMVAMNGLAGNLLVNCAVGCSGGTFNNNADAVASSASNGQVAAWNYVWNGATFDRLPGSAANGVKAIVTNAGTFPVQISAAAGAFSAGVAVSGSWLDGSIVTLGAKADAHGCSLASAIACLGQIDDDVKSTGTVKGAGTAGTADTGVVTVQGIASMTPFLATQTSQYPSGATAITASATGTTAATTATLAGTGGKTTYICGYSIRANATAAATVTNTITGVITATFSSIMWVAPLASGIGVDEQIFSPCIPASATNTGIAIVSGAPGTGGTVSSRGWGYQL